jgi:hypothetical protein
VQTQRRATLEQSTNRGNVSVNDGQLERAVGTLLVRTLQWRIELLSGERASQQANDVGVPSATSQVQRREALQVQGGVIGSSLRS